MCQLLILGLIVLEEEDNIDIYSGITFVIYKNIPRKGLSKKKDGASKDEVTSEPASELSYEERGDAEVVEFIDDYANY